MSSHLHGLHLLDPYYLNALISASIMDVPAAAAHLPGARQRRLAIQLSGQAKHVAYVPASVPVTPWLAVIVRHRVAEDQS